MVIAAQLVLEDMQVNALLVVYFDTFKFVA